MSRAPFWFVAVVAFALSGIPSAAFADPVADNTFCDYQQMPSSLRQTLIVIDGNLVTPEDGPPVAANQGWRAFATRFEDATDPFARQNLDARERVTVAIASADGSGLRTLFTGCVPIFSTDEDTKFQSQSSPLSAFFGADWHASWQKQAEAFKRSAVTSFVSGIKGIAPSPQLSTNFASGSLVQSLTKSLGVSLEQGIPRIIFYTDLAKYDFPQGDVTALRTAARSDAASLRVDLMRSEVHLLTLTNPGSDKVKDYLEAFFLVSKGELITLTAAGGALTPQNPPKQVAVFQGTVDMGDDAKYPLRMRLARDLNGTVVNSWIEMQGLETRFVPFSGIVSCPDADNCEYVGDNVFAQIWSDDPDPDPECPPDMPFGGLRNFAFKIAEPSITGRISDQVCYFTGRENGLEIKLTRVPNGLF